MNLEVLHVSLFTDTNLTLCSSKNEQGKDTSIYTGIIQKKLFYFYNHIRPHM